MESKLSFMEEIDQLDVLDTHTHLVGDRLAAKDFWEIAHYFWLNREMQAAGYPANAQELPENERIGAFLSAYQGSRNTLMNWVLTRIFQELYGIDLKDERSVLEADEAVKASHARSDWAQQAADQMQIRGFVTNIPEHAAFQGMRRNALVIPRIDGRINEWTRRIHRSTGRPFEFEAVGAELDELLASFTQKGYPGIMTTLPRYGSSANRVDGVRADSEPDEILMAIMHAISGSAERRGLFVQLFLGVERSWCGEAVPANDSERILKIAGLFDKYHCPFELVVASELNNLDVVQAAWNFPNVSVGGMWWFNFRASTYRDAMQYRLEAIPSMKSSIIASDARCIEWSYGKIRLVKRLLGEFLYERMASGWIDKELALQVAKNWLHDSAAERYRFYKS
ncbi:glucuronate isomerase [Paenibacillus filicis]|uniref:Glucuronate isomerase n=1 Tax=Paenibacillus gyeongsangnamensis TaxID=3388067 RepID=A0ABT4QBD4_9BACL|nr:glucuronate isomerase [Paenibacillus filicis]MCZ8514203.1 glucuronate isomerase [Paenibacillus filicis]